MSNLTDKNYTINEIFHSIQGEGIRAGTANIFIRFTGCNMKCDMKAGPKSPGRFACDTEFESGKKMSLEDMLVFCRELTKTCKWIILTGGEPALQVDEALINFFHENGYKLAIETNGSIQLPIVCSSGEHSEGLHGLSCSALEWITVSPKVAEHAIKQVVANEVKYVRGYGQAVPKTRVSAPYKLISPAFNGDHLDSKTLAWCINLVKENPSWSLSVQQHKGWMVR